MKTNTKKTTARRSNYNKKRDYSKRQTEAVSDDRADKTCASTNDPSWYMYSKEGAMYNATLNFGTQSGTPFSLDTGNSGAPLTVNPDVVEGRTFPGIMAIYVQPTIGDTGAGMNAPINRAAFEFYTTLRQRQKITYSYDAPDLMKYVITMGSVYAMYAHLNRIYGLVNLYSRENYYYPKAMLSALGVDADSLRTNISDFRAWLNNLAYYINRYAIPNGIYLFARWITLMSNVYTDALGPKAQSYVYVPEYFWNYDEVSGDMTPKYWITDDAGDTPTTMTYDQMIKWVDSYVTPLFNNQDFNNMSSNVNLAYGDSLVTLPAVAPESILIPVKDDWMLLQIQNLRAVGRFSDPKISTNTDTNALEMTPLTAQVSPLSCPGPGLDWTQIMNTTALGTSPEHVMEAMPAFVMTAVSDYVDNETPLVSTVRDCGPDVVSRFRIFYFNGGTLTHTYSFCSTLALFETEGQPLSGDQLQTVTNIVTNLSHFDWHPIVRLSRIIKTAETGNPTKVTESDLICDIDNYTLVERSTLKQIHDFMMISLFRIPEAKPISLR